MEGERIALPLVGENSSWPHSGYPDRRPTRGRRWSRRANPRSRRRGARAERLLELAARSSSSTMSAPPTSSPFTNTCGIVGQPEIADSSWRIAGSGSTSTAVTDAPARRNASSARPELPHITNARCALHEDRDVRAVDHLFDLVPSSSCRSLRLDAQLVDSAVGKRRGERLVHTPVLLDQREADE